MTQTLLHVLAAEPPEGNTVLTRCTIRSGAVHAGDRLCFMDAEGTPRELEVRSVQPSPRWSTIVFAGHPEHLFRIVTGTYVRTSARKWHAPPAGTPRAPAGAGR